ncbi:Hypothetical protein ETEE_2223 [Edwardsiella anguillarum ET080813]|uniref:Uncharacterized protein n=1 Tax=Edwardsiella anguillarum ET080813 TaxID=667120 RepID=A0A076LPK9_9GAMM|nr:Hypothetical protein ETEE_2223 [Edwardsiella anguillarum ET080813]
MKNLKMRTVRAIYRVAPASGAVAVIKKPTAEGDSATGLLLLIGAMGR